MQYSHLLRSISTWLLLLVITGSLNAQTSTRNLRFKHGHSDLAKVAEHFGRTFNVKLAYSTEELAAVKVPAATHEADAVGDLLNKVLAPGGFKATVSGTSWVIKRSEQPRKSKMLVDGQITDESGGVTSATVIIKQRGETAAILIADDKGSFRTNVPQEDGTIEISAVGYLPVKRKFTAKEHQTISLQLTKDATQMENVVVTALGIKREQRALGYATTTITNEQLTDAMATNWTDALSGKVAGLNLVRSNSGPNGSNKIILRGENNLTGDNEALIVIDGVVINHGSGRRSGIAGESAYGTSSDNMPSDYGSAVNDLNMDDVESVTILKGPGAAALYGERAANGAIVITTKSGGKRKKKINATLNSNFSMEQINRWPDLQWEYGQGLDGADYYSYGTTADGASTSGTSSAYGPRFDGQMFYQYDGKTQKVGTERTPWVPYTNKIREFFEKGTNLTNSISVDGNFGNTNARLSFTDVKDTWIMPNTGYRRNTVSLSANTKIGEKLTISAKANYTRKWSDNLPGAGYGNQSIMYWYIFWQPNADLDALKNYWLNGQEGYRISYPYSTFPENPYAITWEFKNATNRHNVTGNVQATYQFTKELSLQVRTSVDLAEEDRAQARPYDAGSKYPKGSYRTQDIFSRENSGDFLLKYAKKINSDFDFSITAGGSMLRNVYDKGELRADSLIVPGKYEFSNARGPIEAIPFKSKYGVNSFYGLITAAYRNYLYLDITGRQDWSSVLATPVRTSNAGFFYPSANLSFVVSEVTKLSPKIDFAKLRFSASSVGSGQTVAYRTAYNYAPVTGGYDQGLKVPALLANPELRPLRTVTYELGANVKMFKGRLDVDVAVYTGNTKDQILERRLDQAAGYVSAVINAGRVNNKGVEVAINVTPIQSLKDPKGFRWNTGIVFSANTNIIKELPDSSIVLRTGPVAGGQIVARVGGSMGDLYGRGYLRAPDGQVIYDEKTGFAKLTTDVVYLGNTIPKWRLGFTNDFSFKQWRLHLLFDAQYGAVGHSLTHYKLAEQGKTTNTLPGRYNGIIGNGVIEESPGKYRKNDVIAKDIDEYYRSHFGADNAEGSTFRTDFIKWREARIEYSLTRNKLKKLGLSRVTFGIYGRNLFIWSKWPGFDPEFGTLAGSDIVQGFEIGQFPSTRSYGCNLVVGL